MKSLICLLLTLSFSAPALAEKLKQGFSVDPKLGLSTLETRGQAAEATGFFWRGSKPGIEVSVKGTTLESVQEARELSQVEFSNIAMLYGKRGNPYEGQISSLVTCDKALVPKPVNIMVNGKERPILLVGANSRKSFGACNVDQIAYWAAYYNFIDEPSKTVFSVRIFKEMKSPTAKQIEAANQDLKDMASRILVKDTK